jgi:hypothetical protein
MMDIPRIKGFAPAVSPGQTTRFFWGNSAAPPQVLPYRGDLGRGKVASREASCAAEV